MLERLKSYSDKKAEDIISNKKKIPSLFIILRKSFTRFIKCYISRKGYKEGKWGFLIALMASLFILMSYLKASLENPITPCSPFRGAANIWLRPCRWHT